MKALYGITFSQVTPESAEQGDFSDMGWISDYQPYEKGDLKRLKYDGFNAAYGGSTWFSTGSHCIDYRTGTEEIRDLHFKNVSESTHKRIERYLSGKPVLGQR